jgi:hypothetical protein
VERRVEWPDAMQFIQQFLGGQLGRRVAHAVDHAAPHRPHRSETILLFEPFNQELGARRAAIDCQDAWVIWFHG